MQTIEERLDAVERRLRRYRVLAWTGGAVLVALGSLAAKSDAIKTRQIEIVNEEDVVVAMIGASPAGGALVLKSPTGTSVLELGVSEGGGAVIVRSAAGGKASTLVGTAEGAALTLHDSSGTAAIAMLAKPGKSLVSVRGNVQVASAEGQDLVALGSGEHGGGVTVRSLAGDSAVALTTNALGGAAAIMNKAGSTVVELHAQDDGSGVVGAFDEDGDGRTLKPEKAEAAAPTKKGK